MAAPALLGSVTQSGGASGQTSRTVAPSGGAPPDNTIIFFWLYKENNNAATVSGFTELFQIQEGNFSHHIFWKRASGEAGNYTANWTGATFAAAALSLYSGADTGVNPFDFTTSGSSAGAQQGASPNVSGTVLTSEVLLIWGAAHFRSRSFDATTYTSPLVERFDTTQLGVADGAPGTGPTGNLTATFDGGLTDNVTAFLCALKPTGGGGGGGRTTKNIRTHPLGISLGIGLGIGGAH